VRTHAELFAVEVMHVFLAFPDPDVFRMHFPALVEICSAPFRCACGPHAFHAPQRMEHAVGVLTCHEAGQDPQGLGSPLASQLVFSGLHPVACALPPLEKHERAVHWISTKIACRCPGVHLPRTVLFLETPFPTLVLCSREGTAVFSELSHLLPWPGLLRRRTPSDLNQPNSCACVRLCRGS